MFADSFGPIDWGQRAEISPLTGPAKCAHNDDMIQPNPPAPTLGRFMVVTPGEFGGTMVRSFPTATARRRYILAHPGTAAYFG